jgi:hypothetical protein
MTNGGRAARSSKPAYQREITPAAKTKGMNQAIKSETLRERGMIHAFERLPLKDSTPPAIGKRTSISDPDSKAFLTTNAPGSRMPLATKASWSHAVACASKRRFKVKAKLSKIITPTDPHHNPATTPNLMDRVRSRAADPAAPNSASISSVEPAPRANCAVLLLSNPNHSIAWLKMRIRPNMIPVCAPAMSAFLTSGRRCRHPHKEKTL